MCTMTMQGMYSFYNEPYDFQLVLGISLVGIPDNWDCEQTLRYIRAYNTLFGEESSIGFCGISIQESTSDEPRCAHLICDNLLTKQKCLHMRVLPVLVQDDSESEPYRCAIVAIRPYCFWVKRSKDSPVLPYMFPKYTSREVIGEEFEANMLLMPNNQRMLVVATMIGTGLIPSDQLQNDISHVLRQWLVEITGSKSTELTERLSQLQKVVSTFKAHPLSVPDELIFAADYKQLFSWTWQWDPRMVMHNEYQRSCQLVIDGRKGNCNERVKRGSRHTGCIRFETSRRRWVVDLSINGCRMQKCFHENLFGIVGGFQEARRWRLDYIRNTFNEFDVEVEERIVNDLVDKILLLDKSYHEGLLDALREPVEGYEHIIDRRTQRAIVDGRLQDLGFKNDNENK